MRYKKKKILQMAFSIYDRDGHRTITAEELELVMKSMGQQPEESEVQEIIKEVDIDGNIRNVESVEEPSMLPK